MAKRKSITGVKRKRPANNASQAQKATPDYSDVATARRAGSIALGPDVTPGKRTLLSIQNSRRIAQGRHLQKAAEPTQIKLSAEPTIMHVSQTMIQSKWRFLDERGQVKAAELFRGVGLPVLAQHTKEASKIEAQDAIALVTRSLCKRLPKMPFPPTTKVSHFDYDDLAKSNRDLLKRLRSGADAIASSKAELEQQRLILKTERRELQRLEQYLEKKEGQDTPLRLLDSTAKSQDMPDAIGLVGTMAG